MPTISYKRAPSKGLQELLKPGRFLAPLVDLNKRKVGGHEHDMHFGVGDKVHGYRGLTRVLTARRLQNGSIRITADKKYTSQSCAANLFRKWNTDEAGFKGTLDAYLNDVEVKPRFTEGEGAVQSLWSRVTEPWTPFDREAALGFQSEADRKKARMPPRVKDALDVLTCLYKRHTEAGKRWSKPKATGTELDQLSVDGSGRLVLLELKDASKRTHEVYYSPFQLLQYVWEWHNALEMVRDDLQKLISARVAVGLTPPKVPQLTGDIRAAIGFGPDCRTPEMKCRYDMVLKIVNQHLPPGMADIETWEHPTTGPQQVA